MDEQDYLSVEDDWDVQISDIPGQEKQPSLAQNTGQTKRITRILRSGLEPRFSHSQRRVQLIATISIVAVVLLALLLGNDSTRTQLFSRGGSVSSTAQQAQNPLEQRQTVVYVNVSPSWGQLLVDGKPAKLSRADSRHLMLAPGKHTLHFDAPPFPARECTLSMPPQTREDTCRIQPLESASFISSWMLNFVMTLADLPQAEQPLLHKEVQNTLEQMAPVEAIIPGEVYSPDGTASQLVTATEPLKATLHLQLDTPSLPVDLTLSRPASVCTSPFGQGETSCFWRDLDCHLFCNASDLFASSDKEWDALGVVQSQWSYTNQDGSVVAQSQVSKNEHLLPLRITRENMHWSVIIVKPGITGLLRPEYNPVCASAIDQVQVTPTFHSVQHGTETLGITWDYIAGIQTQGSSCLGVVTTHKATSNVTERALCLYHVGVFVAVNDLAHKLWPEMPVADTYEQTLAMQMVSSRTNLNFRRLYVRRYTELLASSDVILELLPA